MMSCTLSSSYRIKFKSRCNEIIVDPYDDSFATWNKCEVISLFHEPVSERNLVRLFHKECSLQCQCEDYLWFD